MCRSHTASARGLQWTPQLYPYGPPSLVALESPGGTQERQVAGSACRVLIH